MSEYQKEFSVVFAESNKDIARKVAKEIANLIMVRKAAGLPIVLGLAAGNTPTLLYDELIRLHQKDGLDFSQVITFNLDEYYPMDTHSAYSYHHFMRTNLFDYININPANIHIPASDIPPETVESYCTEYERKIQQMGGINFLILGVGQNGHIAFNEPGSEITTRTRLVTLGPITRHNAASEFGGEIYVPHKAITMGVATILEAHKIVLIASGSSKAHIIQQVIDSPTSSSMPATFLRFHSHTTIYVDPDAAAQIERA